MPTKSVKLAVLTTGVDSAIADLGKLDAAKSGVAGDAVVRMNLVGADLTEEKLAAISAEIKAVTDKGATVRVNMTGTTDDLGKAAADSEALSLAGAKVSTTLKDAEVEAESFGTKMKNAVGGFAGSLGFSPMTLGIAAVGVTLGEGAKQAGDFQKEITLLNTDAGESRDNLGLVASGIKNISMQTGQTLGQLTSGMFMIESAGFHGAAGLKVLQAAAQGAISGGADLGTTADALTTVMNDYHFSTDRAAAAQSALNAIVANGKTHLQDIAASMSRVLPSAAALHVSLGDVGGAMATMTGEGVSAENAAMELNTAMVSMASPNAAAKKTMLEVGTSAQIVGAQLTKAGLVSTIDMITQLVGDKFPKGSAQYIAALNSIMGGHRGLAVSLALSGDHLQTFENNTKAVTKAMQDTTGQVAGWDLAQNNLNVKLDRLRQVGQVALVDLGTVAIPILTRVADAILKLVNGFIGLPGPAKMALGAFLGFAVVILTFSKLQAVVTAAFTAITDTNPILLAITAIALITVLLITHWSTVVKWFDKFRHDVANIFDGVRHDIAGYWDDIFNNTIGRLERGLHDAANLFDGFRHSTAAVFDATKSDIARIWDDIWANTVSRTETEIKRIRTDISNWINDIINFFKNLPGEIVKALSALGSDLLQVGRNAMGSLVSGLESMIPGGSTIGSAISSVMHFVGLAGGGVLNEPVVGFGTQTGTVYHLAENGPELIVPQGMAGGSSMGTAGAGASGGGNGVTVNVYAHPSNNPDEVARTIWEQLRVLRQHMGNQPLGLG